MSVLYRTGNNRNDITFISDKNREGRYLHKTSWTGRESLQWYNITSSVSAQNLKDAVLLQRNGTGRNDIVWQNNYGFMFYNSLADFGLASLIYTSSTASQNPVNFVYAVGSLAGFLGFTQIENTEYYSYRASCYRDNNNINLNNSYIQNTDTNLFIFGLMFNSSDLELSKQWANFVLSRYSKITLKLKHSVTIARDATLDKKYIYKSFVYTQTSQMQSFAVSLISCTRQGISSNALGGIRTLTFS